MGIEPTLFAWEAKVLPLNYTRLCIGNRPDPMPQQSVNLSQSVLAESISALAYLCPAASGACPPQACCAIGPTPPPICFRTMSSSPPPYAVLMVCMGNICRSPTAHGVLREKVRALGWQTWLSVDSCGTHAYHVGEAPDRRSQQHALLRGYDLSDLRARQLRPQDFAHFDLVLVMDHENMARAQALCPPALRHKLHRLTEFCRTMQSPVVPDPYYGGDQGFEHVLDLIEDACQGVLEFIHKSHLQRG